LAQGRERRRAVRTPEAWQHWRNEVLAVIRAPFPAALFDRPAEVEARTVSAQTHDGFRLENVVFESLPGWEVNASLYLPARPGVYPGVVCPTGHSNKTGPSYQQPAQVLARNGYIAVSFDPPGCSGELARLNDHFTNGLIGYLTGFWSQTHFVLDALRCLDYLQTRPEVDLTAGMAVTGVSGGGMTSLFAALVDQRVACVAPACCLAQHEDLHLDGMYTSCPEQFGPGYIGAGLDYVDYVAALAPRPCLLLAGARDEVFDLRSTRAIAREAGRIYAAAGASAACRLFVDRDSGHAYTVAMATATVRWLDRHLKNKGARPAPVDAAALPLLSPDQLRCRPRTDANMFTVNRDEARRLSALRSGSSPDPCRLRAVAGRLLGLEPGPTIASLRPRGRPRQCWHAAVEEVEAAAGIGLPGLFLSHWEDKAPRPGLLWLDEAGRWAAFRQYGFLAPVLRLFEPDCRPEQPRVLSLEVSGLGSLTPDPMPYDLAGWNDSERILTYLSVASGHPVMGLRVRDALAGLACLRSRSEVDPDRLMVGGRGIGALVALHVALLDPGVGRLVCFEMLSHYGALTEQFPFAWRQSVVLPGVLTEYDLPEVAAALAPRTRVAVIDPLDAQRAPLEQAMARSLYAEALATGASVRCGDGGRAVAEEVQAPWPV
jgi:dienelactone hydrolase